MSVVLLHFGGAGTYTAAFTVAVMFVLLFALSFALGSLPHGNRRLSRQWLGAWLKASLPRLAITGVFCAGLFVASSFSGNNGANSADICSRPVAPLSSAPVTPERLAKAIAGMRQMADAASAGDVKKAQSFFFGDTHNVTHDIDGPLRPLDGSLSTNLCQRIVSLETELVGSRDTGAIAKDGAAATALLEEAGRKLGLVQ